MDTYDIARVCHEVNRAVCEAVGDHSQKSFADAEQWQHDGANAGVKFVASNPDAPASALHDAWAADKCENGWVYGPVKDAIAKTHPCLVPYDQLPFDQRIKDHVFRAVVMALRPHLQDRPTWLQAPSVASEKWRRGL